MSHPLYELLFRRVLVRWDPEDAHHRAAAAIDLAGRISPVRSVLAGTFGRRAGGGGGGVTAFGRHLDGPLGAAAGFDKDARMVRGLVALGFSHVELLPIAEHPLRGSWGYQPLSPFAPTARHGEPQGFARFVDACHAAGLGVVQDVVHNHFGPSGNYLPRFAPYLKQGASSWGDLVERRTVRPDIFSRL